MQGVSDLFRITAMTQPYLTAEDELYHAKRYKTTGCLESAHMLVSSHLRMVYAIAREYEGYKLPKEDLYQEGCVGLMKAVKCFDPERNVRLATHATAWIRYSITEYGIRNWRMVKIATTKAQRKLFFNLRSMRQRIGPLTQENVASISAALDVSAADVVEMDRRFATPDLWIDDRSVDGEGDPYVFELPSEEADPALIADNRETQRIQQQAITAGLKKLTPNQRLVFERRLMSDNPDTLQVLSLELGVSIERVRQIEVKALSVVQGVARQVISGRLN